VSFVSPLARYKRANLYTVSHRIRYDDDLACTGKLTENCQFNLAHGAELK